MDSHSSQAPPSTPSSVIPQSISSLASSLASLQPEERRRLIEHLPTAEIQKLTYDWKFWARPSQLPPLHGNNGLPWRYWMLLAGRGFGKTRTGAEWIRMRVESGT